jgi:hypothetical protein
LAAGGIADREYFRMAAHRQIGIDLHPPGAVMLRVEPACRRRCDHAGRPDDGGGVDAAVLELDAARIAADHAGRRHHLDALLGQRSLHIVRQVRGQRRDQPRPRLDQDDA